jgi:hypothetical protein
MGNIHVTSALCKANGPLRSSKAPQLLLWGIKYHSYKFVCPPPLDPKPSRSGHMEIRVTEAPRSSQQKIFHRQQKKFARSATAVGSAVGASGNGCSMVGSIPHAFVENAQGAGYEPQHGDQAPNC